MPDLLDAAPGSELHPIDLTTELELNENTPKSVFSSQSTSNYHSPSVEADSDHTTSPIPIPSAESNPSDNSDPLSSFCEMPFEDIDIISGMQDAAISQFNDEILARASAAPEQGDRPETNVDTRTNLDMDMDADDLTSNLEDIQRDVVDYGARQQELMGSTKYTARRIQDQSVNVRETLNFLYGVIPPTVAQGVPTAPSDKGTSNNSSHNHQSGDSKTFEEYKKRIEDLETRNRELEDASREQELMSRVLQGEVAAKDLELMRWRRG